LLALSGDRSAGAEQKRRGKGKTEKRKEAAREGKLSGDVQDGRTECWAWAGDGRVRWLGSLGAPLAKGG